MAARKSGLGFGRSSLADGFEGFFIRLELGFDFGSAPLGFAIAGTYADGPPQGFKGQTAFPNGFHDGASGHTPANTHLLEVVDHLFLSTQPDFP
jgi:hypothetical protein